LKKTAIDALVVTDRASIPLIVEVSFGGRTTDDNSCGTLRELYSFWRHEHNPAPARGGDSLQPLLRRSIIHRWSRRRGPGWRSSGNDRNKALLFRKGRHRGKAMAIPVSGRAPHRALGGRR